MLSEQFFSAPKWITALMKFRNVMIRSFGLKEERNLSDLVYIESENMTMVCENDKHLDLEIVFILYAVAETSVKPVHGFVQALWKHIAGLPYRRILSGQGIYVQRRNFPVLLYRV